MFSQWIRLIYSQNGFGEQRCTSVGKHETTQPVTHGEAHLAIPISRDRCHNEPLTGEGR